MEVATTTATTNNNHSHSHHLSSRFHHHSEQHPHHHHHLHQQHQRMPSHHSHNGLNVGLISNGTGSGVGVGIAARSPFQREVREWQHIDPDTGALLTGRREADRWINGPLSKYGKISDSQNITQPNGTQHTQRKQLEVLQTRTANGAVQVIRAQTIQKTSSRWSSSISTSASASSSAVASPTIMGALTANNSNNSSKSSHLKSQYTRPGLAIPPFPSDTNHMPEVSSLEICEVSNSSHSRSGSNASSSDIDVNVEVEVDDNDVDDDVHVNGDSSYGVDVDVVVDVGDEACDDITDIVNGGSSHSFLDNGHHKVGNNSRSSSSNLSLLLDAPPSLKLSNLMKSNSSLSSNNSSSNNSTTTTTPSALSSTHDRKSGAGKVSLRAIVDDGENTRRLTSTSTSPSKSTSTSTTTTGWQKKPRSSQVIEQPTLYGNGSQCQSLTKSSVGVNAAESGAVNFSDAGATAAAIFVGDACIGGSTTPTQIKSRQQKERESESFRHRNEHQSTSPSPLPSTSQPTSTSTSTSTAMLCTDDYDDDDELRLTKRHQQRQQTPNFGNSALITRSRSKSTDNLSIDWEKHSESDDDEPVEWQRVSKLRRSFQSSSSSKSENSLQPRRPIDLPTNSVSVARIQAELENGRRLNTAMRNNHVDLAALDTILNGSVDDTNKNNPMKRSSFLTAESLKEIRAGLKKLSDETLYRDDYIPTAQTEVPDEHIEIQDVKKPPERIRSRQLTPEKSTKLTPPKSAFQVFTRPAPAAAPTPAPALASPTNSFMTQHSLPIGGASGKHNTHSLESRQKTRESTSSIDWHLRRKSYGFEKMSPPNDKSMFRMDASTDSGLGRSGEQLGNWSPTDSNAPSTRTTVIHFGETAKVVTKPSENPTNVQKRFRQLKSPESVEDGEQLKRHSIAVDESQYVRDNTRKTSQIHLNGYYDAINDSPLNSRAIDLSENATNSPNTFLQRNAAQQKRVEFCKTEVHFAAESGRVNIVETDGKPPPTNNFRRRRRTTSGPLQTLIKSTTSTISTSPTNNNITATATRPITHFGDARSESKIVSSTTVACKASLEDPLSYDEPANGGSVTFTVPKAVVASTPAKLVSSRNSYATTSGGVDITDAETDDFSAIRGILKNKPIKPKPYHLGDNIETSDALWSVQLRPVGVATKPEFTTKTDSAPSITSTSVAERVRIVEQRQDTTNISQTNGFSTKINLSLGNETKAWKETGPTFTADDSSSYNDLFGGISDIQKIYGRRPSLQELMLHDLRVHQRVLDEGLKSTSLIIKTMRSASEFDEAMRRLSIASAESIIMPPIIIPTPMLRTHRSCSESTRRTSLTSLESKQNQNFIIKSSSTLYRRSSGSSSIDAPVSQPLKHPQRRNVEVAETNSMTSQEEDSADEEVKRLFSANRLDESSDSGGGTQGSSSLEDERFIEYSSSWSRLKAKHTIWRIGSFESEKQTMALDRTDLPKSNVMSIELHSPQTSLERLDASKLNKDTNLPPIAKPRTTVLSQQAIAEPHKYSLATEKPTTDHGSNRGDPNNDFLKIVKETRGARKLREHELSYFGVQHSKDAEMTEMKRTYPSHHQSITMKRSLPQRKTNDDHLIARSPLAESRSETTKQQQMATKWQLLNDKPDLLRHSTFTVEPQKRTQNAQVVPAERTSLKRTPFLRDDGENDEHLYANLATEINPIFRMKSPSRAVQNFSSDAHIPYNRKADLRRDVMILNEMTEEADQSLKAISDDAASKDQRRQRSSHRHTAKPLETINEKAITERIGNDKSIAVPVTRSTLASEAKRSSKHRSPSPLKVFSRARSSSLSSNDSCPRKRSSSLSSEREYENVKVRPKRISTSVTRLRTPSDSHRTAAHAQYCSSGDDEVNRRSDVRLRTSRSTSKPTTTSSETRNHSSSENPKRHRDDHKKRTPSSTPHSLRRERAECNNEVKTHYSPEHHERLKHHSKESASKRRSKDQRSIISSHKIPNEKHERDVRTTRETTRESDHHKHRSSSQKDPERVERDNEKEKEKEKTSRSKGYSSRSGEQKSERILIKKQSTTPPTHPKAHEHRKTTSAHKKMADTDMKHRDPAMSTTRSKNSPLMHGQQHQSAHHPNVNHENHHHHVHSMTTATIAAKQRENRNGKDRK